jgi:hypothetical protein
MRSFLTPILMVVAMVSMVPMVNGLQAGSDEEMSPQEKAAFLDTMFPLAKPNGVVMDVVRVPSENKDIVRNDFVAAFKDGEKTLKQVIAHPETATAIQLFVATDMTYRAGDLPEAAFLYHAGNIRLYYDIEKYPPKESGAGNTNWFLNVLQNGVRVDLVRTLYRQPQVLADVVSRIEGWNIKEQPGYKPGWEFTPAEVPADLFAKIKAESLEYLKPMATLMGIPEYFEATCSLQECNGLPLDQQEDKAVVERRSNAEEVMRRIEREKNLHGVMYLNDHQTPDKE